MNGKKIILTGSLLILLLVGWYVSIRSASGVNKLNAQRELVEQADIYADKELYIRALPLYEQALDCRTELNPQIEAKMLDIYMAQGDTVSYEELVEVRARAGRAAEAEYLQAAEYYLEENGLEEAMALLKQGMEAYPDGKIGEMYEDNRYRYSMRVTKAVEIIPTSGNGYMPAFDGEKWGFVNSRGKFILPAVYDSVVPFNSNGYAVASIDGTYYSIISTGEKYGLDETHVTDVYGINANYIIAQVNGKYSYYTKDFVCVTPALQFDEMTMNACGVNVVRNGERWAIVKDDGEQITDYIYEDVAVNSLGQVFVNNKGMVKQDGLWYLVNVDGQRVCETGFADAKAPESANYIAVADSSGKWGFIDAEGRQVIDFIYQDAWSFSNHLAAVKVVDTWGYISEQNEMVIKEPLEDAKPFHNYIAQAKFLGQAALITMEYQEKQ